MVLFSIPVKPHKKAAPISATSSSALYCSSPKRSKSVSEGRLRKGVCQDFAHLQIACLRSLNLPARYVSGYLRTYPPPGCPRLVGADASHAWVSVYCPEAGWLDLDPTNNMVPSQSNVTLAWGRDYGDVSPVRGVIVGGRDHKLEVPVDLEPLDSKGPENTPK